jgi:DNA-binding response OmpR family regulator
MGRGLAPLRHGTGATGAAGPNPVVRILCVDDDPDILQLIADALRERYEVVTCSHGLEALEEVDHIQPDLIITDVMMPGLNGIDTIRAIKKDATYAHTPVMYLTAKSDNATMREGLIAGGDCFMEKPFMPRQLLDRVGRLVEEQWIRPKIKKEQMNQVGAQGKEWGRGPESPGQGDRAKPLLASPLVGVSSGGHDPTAVVGGFSGSGFFPAALASKSEPVPGATVASVEGMRSLSQQLADAALAPRLRILCVDDDTDILDFYQTILEQQFEVITTMDSEGAPDKIIAYQPDIILLDIQMPRLNGLHLLHLIRLNRRLRGARIVFVSGRNDRETLQKVWRLGASEFVDKPFSPEQLLRKVEDVVRHPEFQRIRKRLDYREVLRREGRITA